MLNRKSNTRISFRLPLIGKSDIKKVNAADFVHHNYFGLIDASRS